MSVYGEVGFPHQDSYENVGSLGSAQTCETRGGGSGSWLNPESWSGFENLGVVLCALSSEASHHRTSTTNAQEILPSLLLPMASG